MYQSKIRNKKSGTGLGLYIHNKYCFNERPDLNVCTSNLETLFITISNTPKPVVIGVVYRPPSGNKKLFFEELENIINKLPANDDVYILGDYNINLHEINKDVSNFEQLIFSSGYAPSISLVTHERVNCQPTCIDNIMTNCSEKKKKKKKKTCMYQAY